MDADSDSSDEEAVYTTMGMEMDGDSSSDEGEGADDVLLVTAPTAAMGSSGRPLSEVSTVDAHPMDWFTGRGRKRDQTVLEQAIKTIACTDTKTPKEVLPIPSTPAVVKRARVAPTPAAAKDDALGSQLTLAALLRHGGESITGTTAAAMQTLTSSAATVSRIISYANDCGEWVPLDPPRAPTQWLTMLVLISRVTRRTLFPADQLPSECQMRVVEHVLATLAGPDPETGTPEVNIMESCTSSVTVAQGIRILMHAATPEDASRFINRVQPVLPSPEKVIINEVHSMLTLDIGVQLTVVGGADRSTKTVASVISSVSATLKRLIVERVLGVSYFLQAAPNRDHASDRSKPVVISTPAAAGLTMWVCLLRPAAWIANYELYRRSPIAPVMRHVHRLPHGDDVWWVPLWALVGWSRQPLTGTSRVGSHSMSMNSLIIALRGVYESVMPMTALYASFMPSGTTERGRGDWVIAAIHDVAPQRLITFNGPAHVLNVTASRRARVPSGRTAAPSWVCTIQLHFTKPQDTIAASMLLHAHPIELSAVTHTLRGRVITTAIDRRTLSPEEGWLGPETCTECTPFAVAAIATHFRSIAGLANTIRSNNDTTDALESRTPDGVMLRDLPVWSIPSLYGTHVPVRIYGGYVDGSTAEVLSAVPSSTRVALLENSEIEMGVSAAVDDTHAVADPAAHEYALSLLASMSGVARPETVSSSSDASLWGLAASGHGPTDIAMTIGGGLASDVQLAAALEAPKGSGGVIRVAPSRCRTRPVTGVQFEDALGVYHELRCMLLANQAHDREMSDIRCDDKSALHTADHGRSRVTRLLRAGSGSTSVSGVMPWRSADGSIDWSRVPTQWKRFLGLLLHFDDTLATSRVLPDLRTRIPALASACTAISHSHATFFAAVHHEVNTTTSLLVGRALLGANPLGGLPDADSAALAFRISRPVFVLTAAWPVADALALWDLASRARERLTAVMSYDMTVLRVPAWPHIATATSNRVLELIPDFLLVSIRDRGDTDSAGKRRSRLCEDLARVTFADGTLVTAQTVTAVLDITSLDASSGHSDTTSGEMHRTDDPSVWSATDKTLWRGEPRTTTGHKDKRHQEELMRTLMPVYQLVTAPPPATQSVFTTEPAVPAAMTEVWMCIMAVLLEVSWTARHVARESGITPVFGEDVTTGGVSPRRQTSKVVWDAIASARLGFGLPITGTTPHVVIVASGDDLPLLYGAIAMWISVFHDDIPIPVGPLPPAVRYAACYDIVLQLATAAGLDGISPPVLPVGAFQRFGCVGNGDAQYPNVDGGKIIPYLHQCARASNEHILTLVGRLAVSETSEPGALARMRDQIVPPTTPLRHVRQWHDPANPVSPLRVPTASKTVTGTTSDDVDSLIHRFSTVLHTEIAEVVGGPVATPRTHPLLFDGAFTPESSFVTRLSTVIRQIGVRRASACFAMGLDETGSSVVPSLNIFKVLDDPRPTALSAHWHTVAQRINTAALTRVPIGDALVSALHRFRVYLENWAYGPRRRDVHPSALLSRDIVKSGNVAFADSESSIPCSSDTTAVFASLGDVASVHCSHASSLRRLVMFANATPPPRTVVYHVADVHGATSAHTSTDALLWQIHTLLPEGARVSAMRYGPTGIATIVIEFARPYNETTCTTVPTTPTTVMRSATVWSTSRLVMPHSRHTPLSRASSGRSMSAGHTPPMTTTARLSLGGNTTFRVKIRGGGPSEGMIPAALTVDDEIAYLDTGGIGNGALLFPPRGTLAPLACPCDTVPTKGISASQWNLQSAGVYIANPSSARATPVSLDVSMACRWLVSAALKTVSAAPLTWQDVCDVATRYALARVEPDTTVHTPLSPESAQPPRTTMPWSVHSEEQTIRAFTDTMREWTSQSLRQPVARVVHAIQQRVTPHKYVATQLVVTQLAPNRFASAYMEFFGRIAQAWTRHHLALLRTSAMQAATHDLASTTSHEMQDAAMILRVAIWEVLRVCPFTVTLATHGPIVIFAGETIGTVNAAVIETHAPVGGGLLGLPTLFEVRPHEWLRTILQPPDTRGIALAVAVGCEQSLIWEAAEVAFLAHNPMAHAVVHKRFVHMLTARGMPCVPACWYSIVVPISPECDITVLSGPWPCAPGPVMTGGETGGARGAITRWAENEAVETGVVSSKVLLGRPVEGETRSSWALLVSAVNSAVPSYVAHIAIMATCSAGVRVTHARVDTKMAPAMFRLHVACHERQRRVASDCSGGGTRSSLFSRVAGSPFAAASSGVSRSGSLPTTVWSAYTTDSLRTKDIAIRFPGVLLVTPTAWAPDLVTEALQLLVSARGVDSLLPEAMHVPLSTSRMGWAQEPLSTSRASHSQTDGLASLLNDEGGRLHRRAQSPSPTVVSRGASRAASAIPFVGHGDVLPSASPPAFDTTRPSVGGGGGGGIGIGTDVLLPKTASPRFMPSPSSGTTAPPPSGPPPVHEDCTCRSVLRSLLERRRVWMPEFIAVAWKF
jgi:hypothetical protein